MQQSERLARFVKRIEEMAQTKRYNGRVNALSCLKGIATHTALSLIVEVGDFNRFPKAKSFASFLGLIPGEDSSAVRKHRLGITKSGNNYLRRLLVESANCFSKGSKVKSKALKARQNGNPKEIIAYADRANERLRRKVYEYPASLQGSHCQSSIQRTMKVTPHCGTDKSVPYAHVITFPTQHTDKFQFTESLT